jgi:hypothetical protein
MFTRGRTFLLSYCLPPFSVSAWPQARGTSLPATGLSSTGTSSVKFLPKPGGRAQPRSLRPIRKVRSSSKRKRFWFKFLLSSPISPVITFTVWPKKTSTPLRKWQGAEAFRIRIVIRDNVTGKIGSVTAPLTVDLETANRSVKVVSPTCPVPEWHGRGRHPGQACLRRPPPFLPPSNSGCPHSAP